MSEVLCCCAIFSNAKRRKFCLNREAFMNTLRRKLNELFKENLPLQRDHLKRRLNWIGKNGKGDMLIIDVGLLRPFRTLSGPRILVFAWAFWALLFLWSSGPSAPCPLLSWTVSPLWRAPVFVCSCFARPSCTSAMSRSESGACGPDPCCGASPSAPSRPRGSILLS